MSGWYHGNLPTHRRDRLADYAGMLAIITGNPVKLRFATRQGALDFQHSKASGRPGVKISIRFKTVTVTRREK
jgi:hypothetical protein